MYHKQRKFGGLMNLQTSHDQLTGGWFGKFHHQVITGLQKLNLMNKIASIRHNYQTFIIYM